MRGVGDRPVPLVDERHDLVAQVGEVVAGAGRVQELAAAERGPAVDPDDDARAAPRRARTARRRARGSSGGTGSGSATCRAGRSGPGSRTRTGTGWTGVVVVAGRQVDPERALVRVAQRVAAERPALDRQLVEPSLARRTTTGPRWLLPSCWAAGCRGRSPGYDETSPSRRAAPVVRSRIVRSIFCSIKWPPDPRSRSTPGYPRFGASPGATG